MQNTVKIILTGYITGVLDVKEGSDFPLNFSIGDIRDISKKNGTTSKTVTLVGNKNNNNLLNNIYDINVKSFGNITFDINRKLPCTVTVNDIVVIPNAYLKLLRVKKSQHTINIDDFVEYEVQIIDAISSLFTETNNKYLTDIDLSDFNHEFKVSAITNSFDNTYVDGYKYILPWISDSEYHINELRPGVYAKEYFDRIHSNAGYSYEWDSLTAKTIQFEKLIIPFTGDDKGNTPDDIRESEVIIKNQVGTGFLVMGIANDVDFLNYTNAEINNTNMANFEEVKDLQNLWGDTVANAYEFKSDYVLPNSLEWAMEVEWEFVIRNNETVPVWIANHSSNSLPLDWSPSIACDVNTTGSDKMDLHWDTNHNTTVIQNQNNIIRMNTQSKSSIPSGSYLISTGDTVLVSGNYAGTAQSFGLTGNSAKLRIRMKNLSKFYRFQLRKNSGGVSTLANATFRINITNIRVVIRQKSQTLLIGQMARLNNYIPKNIKQSDFLKGIYQMFNLYPQTDEIDDRKIIYKTRDEYYDDGKTVDWTELIDKNFSQDIEFIPEISSKSKKLTYKPDNDFANVGYSSKVNEIYGQVTVVFDNENVKGEDVSELIFSPTPVYLTPFNAVTPMIPSINPKCNIRILIDSGLKSCNQYSINDSGGTSTYLTSYPLVSHLNAEYNPTYDINFAPCDFYYYNIINYTQNNLYNNHWRRTFGQINSGKLLTANFNLNEIDINKLRLNDKIRINNSFWLINKVIDYNPTKNMTTQVELISVDEDVILMPLANNSFVDYVPVDPVKPKPTTYDPIIPASRIKAIDEIIQNYNNLRNINTSLILTNKSYLNLGKGSKIIDGFNGIVIGDNLTATESGIYLQDSYIASDGTIYNLSGETISNNFCESGIITSSISGCSPVIIYDAGMFAASFSSGSTSIGGAGTNVVSGTYSSVIGGYGNISSGAGSFIGGGYGNSATSVFSSIIGGILNTTSGLGRSSIIGGQYNRASGTDSLVGGGVSNSATTDSSSVIGGQLNLASGSRSSIVGGSNNIASTFDTHIGGGTYNVASGQCSAVIGGQSNLVSGLRSVVIGGQSITGSTDDTVYVPNLNIGTVGVGTSINNLGIDASGNVVVGDSGSGGTSSSGVTLFNSGTTSAGGFIYCQIEIGVWNMDANISKNVPLSALFSVNEVSSFRNIVVLIKDNSDTVNALLEGVNGNFTYSRAGGFNLIRTAAGYFDNTSWNSTAVNRGFISFFYQPD